MPVSIDERLWLNPSGMGQGRASDEAAKSSMAALVGRVIGAKPFPETARRLAEMTRMPNARIGNAVRVLETDPALSARLLRLVNWPGYALRMRCTSLRHAAALVGLERLNHIATTAAVLDMFSDSSEVATGLLDHSTVVGAFCRYFAVTFSLPAEELFTCGFLHDIGKLLLLEAEGTSYAELLEGATPHQSHAKERERFGFDHASLGAHVLSAWNIPEPVPLIVAWHHDSTRAYEGPVEVAAMIETLRLADDIAHLMGKVSDDRAIRTVAEGEPAQRLSLGRHELSRLWPELRSLREHCRAQRSNQSNFVDVTSVRPTASLPPPSAVPSQSHSFQSRLPSRQSPPQSRLVEPICSLCPEPTSGDLCSACDAPVCPSHRDAREGWCERCVTDYAEVRSSLSAALPLKLGIAAAFVSLFLGALFGALQNGTHGTLRLLAAPIVALALSAVALSAGQRRIVRNRFLRNRKGSSETLVPATVESARHEDSMPAVLTVPPSAYGGMSILRGLPHDALQQNSREALLGSSSRPPESVAPPTDPSPRLMPAPIRIEEAPSSSEPAPLRIEEAPSSSEPAPLRRIEAGLESLQSLVKTELGPRPAVEPLRIRDALPEPAHSVEPAHVVQPACSAELPRKAESPRLAELAGIPETTRVAFAPGLRTPRRGPRRDRSRRRER